MVLGLLLFLISIWLISIYLNYYNDRFYPKTYIDDVNVSGLTKAEARTKVTEQFQIKTDALTLQALSVEIQMNASASAIAGIPSSELQLHHDLETVLDTALGQGQATHWSPKLRQIIKQHFVPARFEVKLQLDSTQLVNKLTELKQQVDQVGQRPSVRLQGGTVLIEQGLDSYLLDTEAVKQHIQSQLLNRRFRSLTPNDFIIVHAIQPTLPGIQDEALPAVKLRAEQFIDHELELAYDYERIQFDSNHLLTLLTWPTGIDEQAMQLLLDAVAAQVNRPSTDAVFEYNPDTLAVGTFTPDQDGLSLDTTALTQALRDLLAMIETGVNEEKIHRIELTMTRSKASKTLEQTNALGIKEVIGFGESWYDHSIPNRIYNVDIATGHLTNHIVKPGEEFSFNQTLGEVSSRTGYRNAYIIEAGQTKLAPGGGVCQVSSTLFRALLNAGVDITRRLPHAYRVSYYEIGNEPGFDATVYAGEVDLRFRNDTPGHILISCQSNAQTLYMSCKLYGTSDGRSSEIVNYRKWGQSGPLPTVYIDDPSLPPGRLEQIDWAASGIRTEFTNIIRDRDGNIMSEDTYKSNYRSWAAKYRRGV